MFKFSTPPEYPSVSDAELSDFLNAQEGVTSFIVLSRMDGLEALICEVSYDQEVTGIYLRNIDVFFLQFDFSRK